MANKKRLHDLFFLQWKFTHNVSNFMFCDQVNAMLESSVRRLWSGSSAYTIGWFGTCALILLQGQMLLSKFSFHLEKSCGYKPIGCSNFSGSQHIVVREIRCKVILVVPVWAKCIQRFVRHERLPVIHMMVASVVVRLSGTMTTRVCHQSDLETSWGVSHCCEVKLRKYPVHPPRPEAAGSTLKRCPVSVQE